jgi:hypothetical protein
MTGKRLAIPMAVPDARSWESPSADGSPPGQGNQASGMSQSTPSGGTVIVADAGLP